MKKHVLLFALFMALAGGVFAQTHWISGEIYGPGGGARYEYVITPRLTVGAYASFMYLSLGSIWLERYLEWESGATVRCYPLARRFFMELNLGVNSFEYGEYREYDEYEYDEYGESAFPGHGNALFNSEYEIKKLQKENAVLREENEILKKLQAFLKQKNA